MRISIGVDEVGRGCWAGPLVAGAVAFIGEKPVLAELDDSKRLSRSKRILLDPLIQSSAAAYGCGWVWPMDIDRYGITWSVKQAMSQAVTQALEALITKLCRSSQAITERPAADSARSTIEIVVDGSYDFLRGYMPPANVKKVADLSIRTLIGADGLIPSVSAASIIAKVARDTYMATIAHSKYPAYGFDRHVGYGTEAHRQALAAHGVTNIHRKSYKPIQKLMSV